MKIAITELTHKDLFLSKSPFYICSKLVNKLEDLRKSEQETDNDKDVSSSALVQSLILQRMDYLIRNNCAETIQVNGSVWVNYKIIDWCKALSLSKKTIERAFKFLRNNYLVNCCENPKKRSQTLYSINYERLEVSDFDKHTAVSPELIDLLGDLHGAIVLSQIHYWVKKNEENGKHLIDGYYWCFMTAKCSRRSNLTEVSWNNLRKPWGAVSNPGIYRFCSPKRKILQDAVSF